MMVRMWLLCCTSAFLLICNSKSQLIPGYIPPILTTYQQTQQIAKAAQNLGLPVPQTTTLVANAALPLLPPAQRLATNVGLPLRPLTQRRPNVGLPLLPKIVPGSIPGLPRVTSALTTGAKLKPLPVSSLLLNTNPLLPRIPPLQIRSTDEEATNEKTTNEEKVDSSINPINEVSEEFKEVVGSSGSFSNATEENEFHQTKPRSPENKENADELDYLSQAANPIDDIGSMIKKVGQGLKHTMQKIDTKLWPSHDKPEVKESAGIDEPVPYKTWTKNYENNNESQGRSESVSDIMSKYLKVLNYGRTSQGPQFQLPENMASGLSNVMDEFQKSISESSRKSNNEENISKNKQFEQSTYKNSEDKLVHPMDKFWNSAAKLADNFVDAMSQPDNSKNMPTEFNQQKHPINKYWEKASNLAGQLIDSNKGQKESIEANQRNNPMSKLLNSASRFVDHLADAMTKGGKSENEVPEKYQKSSTTKNFNEKISTSAENMAGVNMNSEKNNNHQFYTSENIAKHNQEPHQGLNPPSWNVASMVGKNAQFGIHPSEYYGNQQIFPPYSSNFGGDYGNWNYPSDATWNSATPFGQDNTEFNHGVYYKSSNPPQTSSSSAVQYMYPVLSRPYRQMSGSSGKIWDSATGLAGIIANIATNPKKINSDQILESTGNVFNAAQNLAGDVGKFATNPSSIGNNKFLGLNSKDNPIDSGKLQNGKILGSSNQGSSALNPNNPIGAIVNSATNLGSKITNIALNPGNVAQSPLHGSSALTSVSNQGVDLASKIVSTALNPGSIQNGQSLLSLGGPTYAGGFFPRNNPSGSTANNPAGSIVNSATQLASQILNTATNTGNIGKIPSIKAAPIVPNYVGALPISTIVNSATKLAGDITGMAAVPGRLFLH